MKLDMKLVKDILEKIEDSNDSYKHSISLFDEFGTDFQMNSEKYVYTIKTLENAGFITECIPENFDYVLGQLTLEGHKLLKKIRKKERKAQKKFIKKSEYQITPEEEAEIKEQFGDI